MFLAVRQHEAITFYSHTQNIASQILKTFFQKMNNQM